MLKTETATRECITKLYEIAKELKANLEVANIEELSNKIYINVNELKELTATSLSNAVYDVDTANVNNTSMAEAKEANATERYKLMEHIVLSASSILNSAVELSDTTEEILFKRTLLHLESFIDHLDIFNGLLNTGVA